MAISNKIGAPVTGKDFYGRAREICKSHEYLNTKQSLLLSAPRRIGKSSLAKRLLDDKEKEGWKCVYIDLEGIATKESFLKKLTESFEQADLWSKTKDKVRNYGEMLAASIKEIEIKGVKIDLNNDEMNQSVFNRLSEAFDHNTDTLIVIDELPLFLGKLIADGKKLRDVEFLLNWFRSIRQNEASNIRWIFCGSVGLRNFTIHYGLSHTINDLIDFNLGEMPEEEAKGLIKELASSYDIQIGEDEINYMLTYLQWTIPYFIQLLIDRLRSDMFGKESPVSTSDIDKAISGLSRSDYFQTWADRLKEYHEFEDDAYRILDSLSAVAEGMSKETLQAIIMKGKESDSDMQDSRRLTKLLDMLEHDGYIIRDKNYRKFRSPLLRDWWRYKFVE